MKQFLFVLTVAGAVACISTPATAALPSADVLPLELETASNLNPTDTMLAQCYGGGGGYSYGYAPQRVYYRSAPAVSVRVGGGRGYYGGGYGGRGGYPVYRGYRGGFGPSLYGGGFGGGGFGRGYGRGSGVGLFLSF